MGSITEQTSMNRAENGNECISWKASTPFSANNTPWPRPALPDSVFKMFNMTGKVAIITGGSGGIGYEAARALAEAGCHVALFYHEAKNASALAATIARDFQVQCRAYKCAVENYAEVRAQVAAVVADFGLGRLDVMIANSGIARPAGGIDDPIENWHQVMDVNLHGAYYCAKVAGEIFRRQGSGNLIFTASMSGHIANTPQQQVRPILPKTDAPSFMRQES